MSGACALVLKCHGETLRLLADELGVHISGLAHGAALARKRGCGSPRFWRRLRALDTTAAFLRHVNRPQLASFLGAVADEWKALPPAATFAATASISAPAAPVLFLFCAAPAPATKYVAPAPDVTCAAPALVIGFVTPAPVTEYIKPARVAPSFSDLVNPQFSATCAEASAPKVLGSLLLAPVCHAYQEHIVAGQTTQNIVGSFSVLEQVKVQEIPEVRIIERIQEQIEELIGDIPVPQTETSSDRLEELAKMLDSCIEQLTPLAALGESSQSIACDKASNDRV